MSNRSAEETALVEKAHKYLPGGTFGNVAYDLVIERGEGARVWDVSGKSYVDYLIGSGPMIVGHAHPKVTEAVQKQVAMGTTFFANNPHGIKLAEVIAEAVPCVEQVRYVSSGSEADMYAMRLARAYTGREKVLKFEGAYHGMSDYGLMSLAPKRLANFPQPVPDSAGIPAAVQANMIVAPYNDIEAAEGLVKQYKGELAAIIIEPFQRIIPPAPGYLEAIRKLCTDNDIVLIFDEVVTGFRLAYGGGQAYYGVTPDICTMGKAIGGGFPLAAIGGRADIMALFDSKAVSEDKFVVQIGTLSGNPVAAAAGVATLELLREPDAFDRLFATGQRLMGSLDEILKKNGIHAVISGLPPLFDVVFTDGPVTDYRGTFRGNKDMMKTLNALLLERGILKGDSKYYVSLALTEDDIKQTIDAWEDAIPELKKKAAA